MRSVSEHVRTEIYFWGCNPGFLATTEGVLLVDTPQQPINAVQWREMVQHFGPIRWLVNTEPHSDHTAGNAYFPGVHVVAHEGIAARYPADLRVAEVLSGVPLREAMQQSDPDSVWLVDHPDYPPNPPTSTFSDRLDLVLGDHRVAIINHPGHTAPQTSVYLPDEGVVFTGDNVFRGVRTFIQEADPWLWLSSLDAIDALDVETIVPGHGEPCGTDYLSVQRDILESWVGAVEQLIEWGVPLAEALARPPDVTELDPYPMDQRLWAFEDWLTRANLSNLYVRIAERRELELDTSGAELFLDSVARARELCSEEERP